VVDAFGHLGADILEEASVGVGRNRERDDLAVETAAVDFLHDGREVRQQAGDEDAIGLGTPDLYARYFLPDILADFGKAYPTVQIDLRCALSSDLLRDYEAGEVDIVLATQMPQNPAGRFVRSEALFFVTGEKSDAHRKTPLPLAMLPPGNLYRNYAFKALEAHGRSWRLACESASIAGLSAAVLAGLAVTVLTGPAVGHGLRICSGFDGVPNLPSVDLVLYCNPDRAAPSAVHLADYLINRMA
jgi:DNA-binding transcriptional LysR family regulator